MFSRKTTHWAVTQYETNYYRIKSLGILGLSFTIPSILGESHGHRSLVDYSLKGHKESDTAEHTCTHTHTKHSLTLLSSGHHQNAVGDSQLISMPLVMSVPLNCKFHEGRVWVCLFTS